MQMKLPAMLETCRACEVVTEHWGGPPSEKGSSVGLSPAFERLGASDSPVAPEGLGAG